MDSLRDRFASDKNQTDRLPDWLTRLLARGPELATPELSRGLEHGDLGSLGRYRVIRVLGEGASSVVYQGFDPELERLVVLKAFRPDYATGATGLKDMLEEARAFARVQDDHVMLVHEVARAGNTLFLVMPYQEGETLEAFLRNLRASNGKLSRHESLDLALQAALGVGYVAAAGPVMAQTAIKTYPDAPANEAALAIVVKAYDAMGMTELRDDAERVMKKNFPDSLYYTQGKDFKKDVPWWQLW